MSPRPDPPEKSDASYPPLALSTRLEEDFVSPLTAVRGVLEILRDFPDLGLPQRQRFVETALLECARLEKGVEHLASTVYAAAQRDLGQAAEQASPDGPPGYAQRIRFLDGDDTVELDFSDFEFSSSKVVNDFYDVLDRIIEATGRSWYFVVNYRDCTIWPEAWVAFAHRGKKVKVSYSLGTVRYIERVPADVGAANEAGEGLDDPDMYSSREQALAHISSLREGAGDR